MGQLILCKSLRADKPFYIASGKVNIYSLEELMYYVQTANFVARDDFVNEAFVLWVGEALGQAELAAMLRQKLDTNSSLRDFFLPIEAANGYLTNNELQVLNVRLQKYDHMTGLEAKKMYADLYLQQGQYVKAIHAYRRLLADDQVMSSQGHVVGDVWSNLGCAYARLQDFEEAVECFANGYRLNHRLESLQEAVDAACLSGQPELIDDLVMRFAANASQIENENLRMEQLLEQTIVNVHMTTAVESQIIQWMDTYKEQCCS